MSIKGILCSWVLKVNSEIKKLHSKQKKKDYIKSVDDDLYSQLNDDLFKKIILFYNNVI